MEQPINQAPASCEETMGTLPHCAPLANPYVPFQNENAETYQAAAGIIRGTLYPGLDLPFMNLVNKQELSATPLHQLQAYAFAIQELGLYLDTHSADTEALDLFNQYVELYEAAQQRYEDENGPMYQMSAGMDGTYRWVQGPWPWDYHANKEG